MHTYFYRYLVHLICINGAFTEDQSLLSHIILFVDHTYFAEQYSQHLPLNTPKSISKLLEMKMWMGLHMAIYFFMQNLLSDTLQSRSIYDKVNIKIQHNAVFIELRKLFGNTITCIIVYKIYFESLNGVSLMKVKTSVLCLFSQRSEGIEIFSMFGFEGSKVKIV